MQGIKNKNKTRRFFPLHSKHIIREMKCEVLEALLHFTSLTQPKLQLTETGIVPEQRLVRDVTQNSHPCKPHFRYQLCMLFSTQPVRYPPLTISRETQTF